MDRKVAKADQHQSLSEEGPLSPFWLTVPASQLWLNSHWPSNANSWHSSKSSLSNSCIFPFSRLTLVFSRSMISPCCWKKLFVVLFVVSSQSHLPRLGVGPGTPRLEGPLLYDLGSHPWYTRSVSKAVVGRCGSFASFLLRCARRQRRSVTQKSSFDLAACRSYGGRQKYS